MKTLRFLPAWVLRMALSGAISGVSLCGAQTDPGMTPLSPEASADFAKAAAALESADDSRRMEALQHLATPGAVQFAPEVARWLKSVKYRDVAAAVETLSAMRATSYVGRIAELAASTDLPVVQASMEALAAFDDRRCVDAAFRVLLLNRHEWNRDRKAAAAVLEKFGLPEDGLRIAAFLESGGTHERDAAVEALGFMRAREQRHKLVAQLRKDALPDERELVIEALANMGAEDCATQIADVLRDAERLKIALTSGRSGELRAAINALAKLKATGEAAVLRKICDTPEARELRVAATEALHAVGAATTQETVRRLTAMLSRLGFSTPLDQAASAELSLSQEAFQSLARLGALEIVGDALALIGAVATKDYLETPGYANPFLRDVGLDRQCCVIARFLSPDATSDERIGAIKALADFEAREHGADILALLSPDEPLVVRMTALRALGQMRLPGAAEAIIPFLQADGPEALRTAAIDGLAWHGTPAAHKALADFLQTPASAWLHGSILKHLSHERNENNSRRILWREEYLPALLSCLDGQRPYSVRLSAASLLNTFNPPAAAPALVKLLHPEEATELRQLACSTLRELALHLDETTRRAAVEQAKALLPREGKWESGYHVLHMLAALGRGDDFAVMLPWMQPHVDLATRGRVVDLIANWKSPRAVAALVPLLQDPDVRDDVIWSLRKIKLPESIAVLAGLLTPSEPEGNVLTVLAALSETKQPQHSAAVQAMLQRPEHNIRTGALHTLGVMGARDAAGVIAEIAGQAQQHPEVRVVALEALTALKMPENAVIMVRLLEDEESSVRVASVLALAETDGARRLDKIFEKCRDNESSVRIAAVQALGAVGGDRVRDMLFQSLLFGHEDVKIAAAFKLGNSGWTLPEAGFSIFHEAACRRPALRSSVMSAAAHLARNDAAMQRVMQFVRADDAGERPPAPAEARALVGGLLELGRDAASSFYSNAENDAARLATRIVQAAHWTRHDLGFLKATAEELDNDFHEWRAAASVRAVADGVRERDPLYRAARIAGWTLVIQPLVWLLVLLVYPWSRAAQWMMWSWWFRRLAGFGWVGPAVLRGRWLRERMWRPFREALVPPGEVVSFDEWTFYDAVRITPAGGGESRAALRVLSEWNGVAVLRGESGLGKTTLLQALAQQSVRPAAFLRAAECGGGLLEALRLRLPRHVQGDGPFLRALVQRGAPEIYVDAVQEALPEVRARLTDDINALPGAVVLLASQPVEWTRPGGAAEWQLEPLRAQDMAAFLLKQGTAAVEAAGAGSLAERQRAFTARVQSFLDELDSLPPDEARAIARRGMLGNPMEAVLAAELLAAGQTPDPERLLAQRMEHLAEDYAAEQGGDFPTREFGEHLRSWRDSGAPLLRLDVFSGVASFLARHRLLRKIDDDGESWRFRHDKILEWFLRPSAG